MTTKPTLHKVIGIDLGTTYSAVASFNPGSDPKFGEPETLVNTAEGDGTTTASVISMDPYTRKAVVGAWAKRNQAANPFNTIIEIKREMGETFSAETLKKYHGERGGFREGDSVHAQFAGQWLLPQEISAFTLMRMKQVAEEEIGEEIRDAVVTVPAWFTERQRAATREAALLAGLYPRQILPEPTAAAIAYGLQRFETEKQTYLVYDLGGGTFDVSIIGAEGSKIDVIATSGDPRLGGGDFDNAIAGWATDQLVRQFGIDVNRLVPERLMCFLADLKLKAEMAKIILSRDLETNLLFTELMGEMNLQTPPFLKLTRAKFEELIGEYLKRSLNYVDQAIQTAEGKKSVSREAIDAIILVGGSSKIPRVKSMLLDYFQKGDDFVRAEADPDQVVARGAAIEAFKYLPSPPPFDPRRSVDPALKNTEAEGLSDVFHITEHSLGVGVQGGQVSRIITQGTNIPVEITRDDFTNGDATDTIPVHVFQGESQFQAECTQIGAIPITGLEPLPPNKHRFAVTFKLDASGLLAAEVRQVSTGQQWAASFQHKAGVGGLDALAALRSKLLGLYIGKVGVAPPVSPEAQLPPGVYPPAGPPPWQNMPPAAGAYPPPPGGFQAPPPPPGAYPPSPVPYPPGAYPPPQAQATGAYPPPPPPGAYPPPPAAGPYPPPSPPAASAYPPPGAYSPPPAAAAPALVTPVRDLAPDEAQLVRRAHKLLLASDCPRLAKACNAYVTAFNQGATGDDLSDLLADLREEFQDARRQAT